MILQVQGWISPFYRNLTFYSPAPVWNPSSIDGYCNLMIQGAQDSFCRYLMLQKLQLEAYSNELFFPSDSLRGMDVLLHTKVSTVETPVSNIWWTQNVRPGWLLTKDGHFGEFRPYRVNILPFLIGNCQDFIHVNLSQFWEKNLVISMKKFSSLALPRSAQAYVATLNYPIFVLFSVNWSLTGGEKWKRKYFQTFISKSGRSGLQELFLYKRFQT